MDKRSGVSAYGKTPPELALLFAVHLVKDQESFQGQEWFDDVDKFRFGSHELAKAARDNDKGLPAQFFFHTRNDAVHLANKTKDDTAAHGMDRIMANGHFRFDQFNAWQLGRFLEKGFR